MTTDSNHSARLADEPLADRREAEVARRREIQEGLDRRSLIIAEEARLLADYNLARILRHGRAIGEVTRGL